MPEFLEDVRNISGSETFSLMQVRSTATSCKAWGLLSLIKLHYLFHSPILEGTKEYFSSPLILKFRYPQAVSRLKTLPVVGKGGLSSAKLTRLWPKDKKSMQGVGGGMQREIGTEFLEAGITFLILWCKTTINISSLIVIYEYIQSHYVTILKWQP